MIKAVRGMKDLLPPETARWHHIETIARAVFRCYGFQEIRLPLLERTELFTRSIGVNTDIVEKEMYTFPDRHGESLTLRPEATASVVRAFIENRLDQGAEVKKYFTMGPMFRYERPQKGRYRQFHQINAEALGGDAPELDAEMILLLLEILERLQIKNLELVFNSLGCSQCRPAYLLELTALFARGLRDLCDDCQRRSAVNPLRVFDCKSKTCQELLHQVPALSDQLCDDCQRHEQRVLELLDRFGVPYRKNPRLVRGLDYYTRTAFEVITTELGAQDAVAGGGRYNGLIRELGGPDHPAIGFAIGEERLAALLSQQQDPIPARPLLFIAVLGRTALDLAFDLVQAVRRQGYVADMDFADRSLKAQMTMANRRGASQVLIVGDKELAARQAPLKNMQSGQQQMVSIEGPSEILAALGSETEGVYGV
ncbi:MAG: histidine--tRNA ligase [Deltaproteobacteria bacterium]|nr:histidine--tRNA ligase [Deltaproteobacteria bacterium]